MVATLRDARSVIAEFEDAKLERSGWEFGLA
jgi:hypothetical protein